MFMQLEYWMAAGELRYLPHWLNCWRRMSACWETNYMSMTADRSCWGFGVVKKDRHICVKIKMPGLGGQI